MINYDELLKVMDDIAVKQLILQGPPGTGKTWGAKELIKRAIKRAADGDCSDDIDLESCKLKPKYYGESSKKSSLDINKKVYWDMVQFHPSYGYEDFVRGIEVSTKTWGKIAYETVNKIFGKICNLAAQYEENNNKKKFFLIIDEINRADIATVFGELIYALEYRGEHIATPYAVKNVKDGNNIVVPKNLYIIGTMNTADRSVGTIDMAIRRRFLFVDQLPNRNVVKNSYNNKENVDDARNAALNCFDNLSELVKELISPNYKAKDFMIGHTYFLYPENIKKASKEDIINNLKLKLRYQVLPMLREYYEDRIIFGKPKNEKYNELADFLVNYFESDFESGKITDDLMEKLMDKEWAKTK